MGGCFRASARVSSLIAHHPSRSSVPPVIPDLHHFIFDPHRKLRGGLVGGRGQRLARADAEARAVARADDLVALDVAAGELPAAALRAPLNADGGKHRIASVGGDVAGPAVPLSDGGSLREGFVPVAEQQRVGGTP